MIVVHHLNASRSQRVLWLLEELGVPYEVKRYQRDPKTMLAPAELRQVHPLGKSPVVTDDGTTVAESGAIVEFLVDRYDRTGLRPPVGSADYQRYRYWLHYAEGSAMPPLLLNLVVSRLGGPNVPWLVRPVARRDCRGTPGSNSLARRSRATSILWSRSWRRGIGSPGRISPRPISR